MESAAIGLLAERFIAAEKMARSPIPPPNTTALGALLQHVTTVGGSKSFQPMNINFGLFPQLDTKVPRRQRKPELSRRALEDLQIWIKSSM